MTKYILALIIIIMILSSLIIYNFVKNINFNTPNSKSTNIQDVIQDVITDNNNLGIMKTYRVADTVDGITGRNTGDLGGDNGYISGEFCSRHPDECDNALLSEYTVLYNTSKYHLSKDVPHFGPYAFCNPGGVVGGTGDYKCSSHANTYIPKTEYIRQPGAEIDRFSGDIWYSWPKEAMCKPNQNIGDNDCRWKLVGTPKSVSIKKLKQNGYKVVTKEMQDQWTSQNKNTVADKIKQFVLDNKDSNEKIMKKFI